jgi:lipopolysaccharide/colanic/teichoic acid biosynthesis glycosyltransferase
MKLSRRIMKINNISRSHPSRMVSETAEEGEYTFYGDSHFHHMLRIERQRTERSLKPFLLVLLDISELIAQHRYTLILEMIKSALDSSLREVDVRGWYEHDRIIGIIVTEIASHEEPATEDIFHKINDRFCEKLDTTLIGKIGISFHIYPETNGHSSIEGSFQKKLYPDLAKQKLGYQAAQTVKKVIDVVISSVALLCLAPVFLMISTGIKLTSDGPVFFRQTRLGFNGVPFDLLKFRSMYVNNDSAKHREYIEKYIGDPQNAALEPGVFKLKADPRITPIGKILRKTSLDEFPQLINVLKGEMSLVGPRPPIPYEKDLYDIWHRRRLLACKPGITGLWQVTGRSRTTFDEMVRLDLKYISEWSLWLDIKIILKTPKAMLTGEGAY